MKHITRLEFIYSIALLIVSTTLHAEPYHRTTFPILIENTPAIKAIFTHEAIIGTCVIYDVQANKISGFNPVRSKMRFPPASTFKIFNSLIGLSSQVIPHTDKTFYTYDGSEMFLETWKNDMNLKQGMQVSHVPAFQKLATMIGYDTMKANIKKLRYGNQTIGTPKELTTFWLQGPLKISAIEQTQILAQLAQKTLPFSQHIQDQVHKICLLKQGKTWKLYGKTGWSRKKPTQVPIGWFVGWVEEKGRIYSFAMNMDAPTLNDLPLRITITKRALKAIGLLQE